MLPEQAWFAASAVLSILYFGQVRTHGLVHNKADLVPWTFFALMAGASCSGCSCTTEAEAGRSSGRSSGSVFCAQLLLGLAYGSSALHKVMHAGIGWAHGSNFQKLMVQMQLEYGRIEWCRSRGGGKRNAVDALLRLLLSSTTLATALNSATLMLEFAVLPAVLFDATYSATAGATAGAAAGKHAAVAISARRTPHHTEQPALVLKPFANFVRV